MPDINKPMDVPELNLQPPITGKVKLSPDMMQTLATLCAVGNAQRVLLQASESGVLLVGEPVIKDIVILTGAIPAEESLSIAQGSDIPCSMAMVMAHPDNTDTCWVRPYNLPDDTHKWPMQKWDIVKFAVDNLNRLHFLFDTDGEKVIIAYMR